MQGRNGAYPIKGIDTSRHRAILANVFKCRNGAYPIKGIDTFRSNA